MFASDAAEATNPVEPATQNKKNDQAEGIGETPLDTLNLGA
jgi:hypothetical protein